MRFVKRSRRDSPAISIVLLDWQVRESFHLFHYLARQTLPRDRFEVILVEYYSHVADGLRPHEDQLDTWLLLEMPEDCYYHKHLMYNAGIVVARGDVVVFMDSDAMVRESFLATLASACAAPDVVVHLDQFRNIRRDLYPFRFPSFEEVLGDGCINNVGGLTRGLGDTSDPLHARNYGACMAARRADLIGIGGADEHRDYLGHICGPYDMTFRLINTGKREVWLDDEFTYHTWHPGQAGEDNWMGPHDGRHMSTTALRALATGRVLPLEENPAIRALRTTGIAPEAALELLIRRDARREWRIGTAEGAADTSYEGLLECYRGAQLVQTRDGYAVRWPEDQQTPRAARCNSLSFASLAEARAAVDGCFRAIDRLRIKAIARLVWLSHLLELGWDALRKRKLTLRNLFSRAGSDRLAKGVREGAFVSSDIANLIAMLLLLPRSETARRSVVVLGAGEATVLRSCMTLGLLPRCAVSRVGDTAQASTIVSRAALEQRRLLVSVGAFVRFHENFSACRRTDVLVA